MCPGFSRDESLNLGLEPETLEARVVARHDKGLSVASRNAASTPTDRGSGRDEDTVTSTLPLTFTGAQERLLCVVRLLSKYFHSTPRHPSLSPSLSFVREESLRWNYTNVWPSDMDLINWSFRLPLNLKDEGLTPKTKLVSDDVSGETTFVCNWETKEGSTSVRVLSSLVSVSFR